ncbi:MAG: RNA polymerase sigma factor RpoD/SigA [Gemmatimonadota bacterium]|nr:RNA polymerase sigma factor RpoD/SigA [Gemmatimonadota bacterium]
MIAEMHEGRATLEDRSLKYYYKEVDRHPRIDAVRERALAARIEAGDEAAIAALVNANLRFVIHIARGYQNQGLPLGDLINEGNCGLFTAARKFDRNRGCRFITYAVWWIRQHILKALDVQTRTVRVPASVLNDIGRMRKTEDRLMQRLERNPEPDEVAALSGLPVKRLDRCLDGGANAVSLDTFRADDSLGIAETLPDRNVASAEETLLEKCRTRALEETLDALSERHRKVITLYFGMHGEEPTTYQEIGRRLGISRERVRQLKEDAFGKLRRPSVRKRLEAHL